MVTFLILSISIFFMVIRNCASCAEGLHYCGHEVPWLATTSQLQNLYRCSFGSYNYVTSCTFKCIQSGRSHCGCEPGIVYCGHELPEYFFLSANSLYRCSYDGTAKFEKSCQGTCKGTSTTKSRCEQGCSIGRFYCGRELATLESWTVPYSDYDFLYKCTNGKESTGSKCTHSCISRSGDSYCSCSPNMLYCGHETKGWTLVDNTDMRYSVRDNTLYRCSSSGESISSVKSCAGICVAGSPSECQQHCSIGQQYCGRELANLEGWTITSSMYNNLYKCTNGRQATGSTCTYSCVSRSGNSYCACSPNMLYCGHETKGWALVDKTDMRYSIKDNILYRCSFSGESISSVKSCAGICKAGSPSACHQSCSIGQQYCGRELANLEGWTITSSSYNYLYKCINGRETTQMEGCTHSCISRSGNSYCACSPNRLICGHETKGWTLVDKTDMRYSVKDNILYRCSSSGESISSVKSCAGICKAGSPSACHQSCSIGQQYCGRELANLEGWTVTSSSYNYLYKCTNRREATQMEGCTHSCVSRSGNSYCACSPNRLICGHETKGWTLVEKTDMRYSVKDNTLYRCSSSGESISSVKSCAGICKAGSPSACHQSCSIGQQYCGRELANLEGWTITSSSYNYLYKCINGRETTQMEGCTHSCISRSGNSYCACSPNRLICGHETKGWTLVDKTDMRYSVKDNTLYRCSSSGESISSVKSCAGICKAGSPSACHQDCRIGQEYCGHEFVNLESWTVKSSAYNNLYKCTNGQEATFMRGCSQLCINSSGRSFCSCLTNQIYCGHQLKDDYSVISNNIYRCSDKGATVHHINSCRGSCVNSSTPMCLEYCVVGRYYCGRQVANLEGWNKMDTSYYNHLYKCDNGTRAIVEIPCKVCIDDNKGSYCKQECMPGNKYCGSELNKFKGWSGYTSNSVYKCSNDSVSAEKTADCKGECKEALNSYCSQSCSIGIRYCGHDLSQLEGWSRRIKEEYYNALYLCTNVSSAEYIKTCHDVCKKETPFLSYCYLSNCTIGQMYCGHELEGWPDKELNSLYQCTNSTEANFNKTCQGTCHAESPNSICLQHCINGQMYCGHELQKLENWRVENPNGLYKCNGSHGVHIKTCHSCRVVGEDRFCSTPCQKNWKYCGSQLNMMEGWSMHDNNTLYVCVSDFTVDAIKVCDGHCASDKERHSFCQENNCEPDALYCGYKLIEMESGYVSRKNDIYSCSSDMSFEVHQSCETECFEKNPQPYCDGCKPNMVIVI